MVVLIWVGPALEEPTGKARTALTEIALMISALGYFRYRKLPIIEICRWRRVPLAAVPYFILFGLAGAVLLDGLDRIIALIIPLPLETLESFRTELSANTGLEKFLIIAGIGFIAPFVEESIFRGAIQTTFERRSDVTKGVMMTALIFGLIHFQIAWLIQLLIMSVFLGWMAWQWNSIVPALFLHAANNILSYYLMFEMHDEVKGLYLFHGQLNPVIAIAAIATAYASLQGMSRVQRHN